VPILATHAGAVHLADVAEAIPTRRGSERVRDETISRRAADGGPATDAIVACVPARARSKVSVIEVETMSIRAADGGPTGRRQRRLARVLAGSGRFNGLSPIVRRGYRRLAVDLTSFVPVPDGDHAR
jgi:hypothetical protein